MSPTWAGWDVLYWSLMAGWAALIVLLIVVGTRGAWRWWSDRGVRRRVHLLRAYRLPPAHLGDTTLWDEGAYERDGVRPVWDD